MRASTHRRERALCPARPPAHLEARRRRDHALAHLAPAAAVVAVAALQQGCHLKGGSPAQPLPIQLQNQIPLLQAGSIRRGPADKAHHPHTLLAAAAAAAARAEAHRRVGHLQPLRRAWVRMWVCGVGGWGGEGGVRWHPRCSPSPPHTHLPAHAHATHTQKPPHPPTHPPTVFAVSSSPVPRLSPTPLTSYLSIDENSEGVMNRE